MRPEDLLARLEAGYAYDPMYGQLCNERDQLKAENAELRELVLDIYWDYVTDDTISDGSKLPYYHERMRKLGIEVPE